MMNSDEILDALTELKELKTKAKEARLAELLKDGHFLKVCKYAYDPFITFGVKKLPTRVSSGLDISFTENSDIWALLDKLASRTVTGNKAIEAIEFYQNRFGFDSAILLQRIIGKNLKAGFTAKTVNKARPGSINVFECMLAHKYEPHRIDEFPVSVEPKYDGVRALCVYKDDTAKFYSRTGKELQGLDHISSCIFIALKGYRSAPIVIDGEVIDPKGFNEIVGAVHRKDEQSTSARFMMFDAIPTGCFTSGASAFEYTIRRKSLERFFDDAIKPFGDRKKLVHLAPTYLASSHVEIETLYQNFRDSGHEGAIVKPRDGLYRTKRSFDWLKIKDRDTIDLPIIGFEQGTGKNESRLGALICKQIGAPNGEVRVGGGLTDALRDVIWNNKDHFEGMICEIEFHEKTADGSLRHPRFIRFRDKYLEDGPGA